MAALRKSISGIQEVASDDGTSSEEEAVEERVK